VTVTEPGMTVGLCHATVGLDEPGDTVTDPSVTSLVVGLRRTPPSVAEMQADALTQATAFTGVTRSTGDPQVAVEESSIPWTAVDPDAPMQDVEVAKAGEVQEIPVIEDAERPGRAVDFQLPELEGLADHVTDPSVALAAAQRPDAAQETSLNAGPAEYTSDQMGVAAVGFAEEKIEPALSTAMQSVEVEQEIPVKVSSESVDSTWVRVHDVPVGPLLATMPPSLSIATHELTEGQEMSRREFDGSASKAVQLPACSGAVEEKIEPALSTATQRLGVGQAPPVSAPLVDSAASTHDLVVPNGEVDTARSAPLSVMMQVGPVPQLMLDHMVLLLIEEIDQDPEDRLLGVATRPRESVAMQSLELGHETLENGAGRRVRPDPVVKFVTDQLMPGVNGELLLKMVPSGPTATHSDVDGHERPSMGVEPVMLTDQLPAAAGL